MLVVSMFCVLLGFGIWLLFVESGNGWVGGDFSWLTRSQSVDVFEFSKFEVDDKEIRANLFTLKFPILGTIFQDLKMRMRFVDTV
jgi:hypothetical protein